MPLVCFWLFLHGNSGTTAVTHEDYAMQIVHHFQTTKPIVISRKGCIIVTSPGWLRSTSGLCGHELAHLSARWKWQHAVSNKENRDKSRRAQKSWGFTARFMVFWSTSLLFRASLMGQNGCFVLASFIALHYFSRTSAQIEPHRRGSDECEGRCRCASVHVCLDKCTFPVTPHLQKATDEPKWADETLRRAAHLTSHLAGFSWQSLY